MKTKRAYGKKGKSAEELLHTVYHLTLQNNNMQRRLINSPIIDRKNCNKIIQLLGYFERIDRLTPAELAEITKEAKNVQAVLIALKEARPLMP